MSLLRLRFPLALVAACAALSTGAQANVGGYMGGCYTGSGFRVNEVCATSSAQSSAMLGSDHVVTAYATAKGRYTEPNGEALVVSLSFGLNDPSNFFDPEGRLPVLVRVISAGIHRAPPAYRVYSTPVTLMRAPGERRLSSSGDLEITLHNAFGAEYVEEVDKVEILVPGFPGVLVLDL